MAKPKKKPTKTVKKAKSARKNKEVKKPVKVVRKEKKVKRIPVSATIQKQRASAHLIIEFPVFLNSISFDCSQPIYDLFSLFVPDFPKMSTPAEGFPGTAQERTERRLKPMRQVERLQRQTVRDT